MDITNTSIYNRTNLNFKKIKLSSENTAQAERLLKNYSINAGAESRNKLFDLFQESIKTEAVLKAKGLVYNAEEIMQNMYLLFFTTLDTIKKLPDPLKELCNTLNNYTPGKNEVNPEHKIHEVRLNKRIRQGNYESSYYTTLEDIISTDETLIPLSSLNDGERYEIKKKIENSMLNSSLTDKAKKFLLLRADGKMYKEISKECNTSNTRARVVVQRAIAKMQNSHNSLPQKYTNKAEELITVLELKQSLEEIKQWLIKNPFELAMDTKLIKERVVQASQRFNIDYQTMLKCSIKGLLFREKPDTIEKNIIGVVNKFKKEGLTTEQYIKACINKPSLFKTVPNTVEKNILEVVKKFEKYGLTREKYIKACIKHPNLFSRSADSLEKNICDIVKKFKNNGLQTDTYFKACIKHLGLLCYSPDTIEKHIVTIVNKYEQEGLNIADYIKTCLRYPQLLRISPDTIIKNVDGTVTMLKEVGLNTKDYIKACVKQGLFKQNPNTIVKNVTEFVDIFKTEGLNTKDYIKACIKQPTLFCMSPRTLEGNVRGLVCKFETKEFKITDYLKICIRYPSLFCTQPDTISNKIDKVVNEFKNGGLTIDTYLKTCLKQPQLFILSSDTIIEHIKAYMYGRENKDDIQTIMRKTLSYSTSFIYLKEIILSQLKKQNEEMSKWKINGSIQKLQKYFAEHPDAQFTIKLIDNDMTDSFIKTIQKFSGDNFKRDNIFEFVKK